jgi:hypothetical protein
MLVPVKVPVLGYDIKIKYVKKTPPTDSQGYVSRAEYNGGDKSIEMFCEANKDAAEFLQTLYHELGHAMLDISGQSELLDDKAEEALCELIGHTFAPLVVFSPQAKTKFKEVKMPWEERDGE